MHLKAREELEKALILIETKENQESELTDLLQEEKKEKKQLYERILHMQRVQEQQ